jgi:hypothetical protein
MGAFFTELILEEIKMNMPGFTAVNSLNPIVEAYVINDIGADLSHDTEGTVVPSMRPREWACGSAAAAGCIAPIISFSYMECFNALYDYCMGRSGPYI